MTDVTLDARALEGIERLIAPTGKQLEVVLVANSSLYALRWTDGGSLPDDYGLSGGKWTTPYLAKEDARKYLRDFWALAARREDRAERVAKQEERAARAERKAAKQETEEVFHTDETAA